MKSIEQFIPLMSVIVVAILGFISNILITRVNQKQNVSNKIIEQYFKIREEISDKISDLVTLKTVNDTNYDIINISKDISKLYYKYYDFLPREVLNEILCLHLTLTDQNNNIFRINNKSIQQIKDEEIEDYIKSTSYISNSKFFTYFLLKNDDVSIRRIASINLQAKKVLDTMNDFFTLNKLMYWAKYTRKD